MQYITRKKSFWIIVTIFSLIAGIAAYYLFPIAFSIVNIDLKMNRSDALKEAHDVAQQYNLGPQEGYYTAVDFEHEEAVHTFVELEGGGKQVFTSIMEQHLYEPYRWIVRHFVPNSIHEVSFYFTPEGKPYGFHEKLPEDAPGAALEQKSAQIKVENFILDWDIDLNKYILVEPSQKVWPSGRIDHTFIYERSDVDLKEGKYRLSLDICGDKVTRLEHSVKIPESFNRRYQYMRSYNNFLANIATIFMIILYGLFGCSLGLIFLLKRQAFLWHGAFIWAISIAFMHALSILNRLPLLWRYYRTSFSIMTFLLSIITQSILSFIYMSCIYIVIFCVAEGLTRYAFKNHPQLWRVWNSSVAASLPILGRTLGGYLILGFKLLFITSFYFLVTRYFKWWVPSDALTDPNILATYIPALNPLAMALHAAFLEECLFRAIPLAGAALIGQKYNKRTLFIGIAFVMQALIFGAAHANYPAQPFYARMIEIFFPACGFGLLYLLFGLLPAIILHFAYDAVLMSLPIFVSNADYALVHKSIVIVGILAPFLIVLYARFKTGLWRAHISESLNSAWQEPVILAEQLVHTSTIYYSLQKKHIIGGCIAMVGMLIAALFSGYPYKQFAPPLHIQKQQAMNNCLKDLDTKYEDEFFSYLPDFSSFTVLAKVTVNKSNEHQFAWQIGGETAYEQLIQTGYLSFPHWTIRFARFEGDLIDRTESYLARVNNNGMVYHSEYIMPESWEGMSLNEANARSLIEQFIQKKYNLDLASIRQVEAVSYKRPNRIDWRFDYEIPHDNPLKIGQTRLSIEIAGNHIVNARKYLFVPEEWQFVDAKKRSGIGIIATFSALILMMICFIALLYIFKNVPFSSLNYQKFFIFLGIFSLLHMVSVINSLPFDIALFSTAQEYNLQLFMRLLWSLLGLIKNAVPISIFLVLLLQIPVIHTFTNQQTSLLLSGMFGLIIGFYVWLIAKFTVMSTEPLWADFDPINNVFPFFHVIKDALIKWLWILIIIQSIYFAIQYITNNNRKNPFFGILLIVLASCSMVMVLFDITTLIHWFIACVALSIINIAAYLLFFRYESQGFWLTSAAFYIVYSLIPELIYNVFDGAMISYAFAIALIIGIVFYKERNKFYGHTSAISSHH